MRRAMVTLIAAFGPLYVTAQTPATRPASGPATQPSTEPAEFKLTLHPAAVARPALRYRLLPEAADLTPGNAAVLYYTASELAGGMHFPPSAGVDDDTLTKWLSAPMDQLPRERADRAATDHVSSLHYVELAARRDRCEWDIPWRTEGFNTLLVHVTPMRQFARLLALRAKLQIADGKYDEAAHTLQTGFAMAYHLNRGDTFLVQNLVAAAVDNLMLDQVRFWVSQPGSPNLYWALTDLPRPMCDIRSSLGLERATIFGTLPHFKEARDGKLTAAHFEEMAAAIRGMAQLERENLAARLAHGTSVKEMTPEAKRYLAAAGYTAAQLDAMEPTALVGLYLAKGYDDATQEMFKFAGLPYWQANRERAVTEAEEQFQPHNPLIAVFLPPTHKAALQTLRPTRGLEALRVIEAIRAYAAAHDGRPPEKLSDLVDLPAPTDPATGQPFAYAARADGFTLDAPMPPGGGAAHGEHYEVQLQK